MRTQYFSHVLIGFFLVLLSACGSDPQAPNTKIQERPTSSLSPIIPDPGTNPDESATLVLELQTGNPIAQGRSKQRYLGGYDDIDNISIDVKNPTSGSTLQTVALQYDGSRWSGTVYNVFFEQVYQFDGRAYDNMSVLIFSGTSQQSLDNGTNTLYLRMDPIADETVLAIPRITRILAPSSVGTQMSDEVFVEIEGSSGSRLNY